MHDPRPHLGGLVAVEGERCGVQQRVHAVARAPHALRAHALDGVRQEAGDGLQRGLGRHRGERGRRERGRDEMGQQRSFLHTRKKIDFGGERFET